MDEWERTLAVARSRGADARRCGRARGSNPYVRETPREHWFRGFDDQNVALEPVHPPPADR